MAQNGQGDVVKFDMYTIKTKNKLLQTWTIVFKVLQPDPTDSTLCRYTGLIDQAKVLM